MLFPHLDTTEVTQWMGHRPCMPDSLPVIGRSRDAENAWLAFGHGHMGMCMGATTGREVAHLVAGRATQGGLIAFQCAFAREHLEIPWAISIGGSFIDAVVPAPTDRLS